MPFTSVLHSVFLAILSYHRTLIIVRSHYTYRPICYLVWSQYVSYFHCVLFVTYGWLVVGTCTSASILVNPVLSQPHPENFYEVKQEKLSTAGSLSTTRYHPDFFHVAQRLRYCVHYRLFRIIICHSASPGHELDKSDVCVSLQNSAQIVGTSKGGCPFSSPLPVCPSRASWYPFRNPRR